MTDSELYGDNASWYYPDYFNRPEVRAKHNTLYDYLHAIGEISKASMIRENEALERYKQSVAQEDERMGIGEMTERVRGVGPQTYDVEVHCKGCDRKWTKKALRRGEANTNTREVACCKHCETPKFSFAPIDAKDRPVVGLDGRNYGEGYAGTADNYRVVETAEKEYLERLEQLQQDIQDKYGKLLKPESGPKMTDEEQEKIYNEVWAGIESRYRRYDCLYYT